MTKSVISGSPPLARGKDEFNKVEDMELGITPACAGKRAKFVFGEVRLWDHPRLRGEKTG